MWCLKLLTPPPNLYNILSEDTETPLVGDKLIQKSIYKSRPTHVMHSRC